MSPSVHNAQQAKHEEHLPLAKAGLKDGALAQDAAGKAGRTSGSRAKSRSMDDSQEAGASVAPASAASAQPQSSSTAGPDAAAIVSHSSCLSPRGHSSMSL